MSLIHNDYFSADEVATLHRASRKSVYRWVKAGLLKAEVLHGMLWIDKKQAESFRKPKRGRKNRN